MNGMIPMLEQQRHADTTFAVRLLSVDKKEQ